MDWIGLGIYSYALIGAMPSGYLTLKILFARELAQRDVIKRLQWSAVTGIGFTFTCGVVAYGVSFFSPSIPLVSAFVYATSLGFLGLTIAAAIANGVSHRSEFASKVSSLNPITPSPLPSTNPMPASSPLRNVSEPRSEEHTSELQSHVNLVCRLLLEKTTLMSSALLPLPWLFLFPISPGKILYR